MQEQLKQRLNWLRLFLNQFCQQLSQFCLLVHLRNSSKQLGEVLEVELGLQKGVFYGGLAKLVSLIGVHKFFEDLVLHSLVDEFQKDKEALL